MPINKTSFFQVNPNSTMKQYCFLIFAALFALSSGQGCVPTQAQIDGVRTNVQNLQAGVQSALAGSRGPGETDDQVIIRAVCEAPVRQYTNNIETAVKGCLGLLAANGTGLSTLTLGDMPFVALFQTYSNVQQFCDCTHTKAMDLKNGLMYLAGQLQAGTGSQMCAATGVARDHLNKVVSAVTMCPTLKAHLLEPPQILPLVYLANITSSTQFCNSAMDALADAVPNKCGTWQTVDAQVKTCTTTSDDTGDGCKNRDCIMEKFSQCGESLVKFYAAVWTADRYKVAVGTDTCGACTLFVSITTMLTMFLAFLFI